MQVRPVSPSVLVAEIAGRIEAHPARPWVRVVVDGPPAADPAALADALVDPLRVAGRPVQRVSAGDFLRPASLRLEHGREDPDARYDGWLDSGALLREVLAPLAPGGTGEVLPSLWDAAADRPTRAGYVRLPVGGVLLLDGALLLGRGLPVDFAVHLWISEAALARRTPLDLRWELPAHARYAREAAPLSAADLVVRVDDPARPAVVDRLE